jgi:NAD(P)H-hydrate epimerase
MPPAQIPASSLFLTSAQSRAVDHFAITHLAIPGLILMENAGQGATQSILTHASTLPSPPLFVIFTGSGNNAGDGFVVARHLLCASADILLIRATPPDKLTGDARTMSDICLRLALPTQMALTPGSWQDAWLPPARPLVFIDALMGTGAQGPPRPHFADLIHHCNRLRKQRPSLTIALDLPSGLNIDTGDPSDPTIVADHTLTFCTMKQAYAHPATRQFTGPTQVIPIGLPDSAIQASLK